MRLALDTAWVPSLLGVTRLDTTSNFTIKWPGRRAGSGSPGSQSNRVATKLKTSKSFNLLVLQAGLHGNQSMCYTMLLQIPRSLAQCMLLLLAFTRKPNSDQTFLLAHICTTQHCSRYIKKGSFPIQPAGSATCVGNASSMETQTRSRHCRFISCCKSSGFRPCFWGMPTTPYLIPQDVYCFTCT